MRVPERSLAYFAVLRERYIRRANNAIVDMPPMKPNSSVMEAKMKSDSGTGRKPRWPWVPCRKPLPRKPPDLVIPGKAQIAGVQKGVYPVLLIACHEEIEQRNESDERKSQPDYHFKIETGAEYHEYPYGTENASAAKILFRYYQDEWQSIECCHNDAPGAGKGFPCS